MELKVPVKERVRIRKALKPWLDRECERLFPWEYWEHMGQIAWTHLWMRASPGKAIGYYSFILRNKLVDLRRLYKNHPLPTRKQTKEKKQREEEADKSLRWEFPKDRDIELKEALYKKAVEHWEEHAILDDALLGVWYGHVPLEECFTIDMLRYMESDALSVRKLEDDDRHVELYLYNEYWKTIPYRSRPSKKFKNFCMN